jgi:hypothetical protein
MTTATVRRFHDRSQAGRLLAEKLRRYAGRNDVVVLGLPRGGVPVAFEIARALNAPLDVFLVRKLGVPGYEEAAFGAIATGGTRVLNKPLIEQLQLPEEEFFHDQGVPAFVIDTGEVRGRRLERAIGVVYRPETERISHYFHARIADQFDAVIRTDETHAVEPLERPSLWEAGELPETYPWGV